MLMPTIHHDFQPHGRLSWLWGRAAKLTWALFVILVPVSAVAQTLPQGGAQYISTTGQPSATGKPSAGERASVGNRLWVISTREAPNSAPPPVGVDALRYWRFDPHVGWLDSSLYEFIASSGRSQPTVVWVHGNRISVDDVMPQAIAWLKQLDRYAIPSHPFRLVAWSWPSGRIPGLLTDVRIKAARSDCQSFYLAGVIDSLPAETPLSLVGFSYGARLVASSLHLLGGGSIDGAALATSRRSHRSPRRAVLMAAAFDNDWLLPGHHYQRSLDAVDQMLIFSNPRDPVLRFYPWLDLNATNPEALGITGLATDHLGPQREKLYQVNVSRILGATHNLQHYVNSPQIISRVAPYALFE